MNSINNGPSLLLWILDGGALVLAAVFSSWYLETIPAWHALSNKSKQLWVLGIALILSMASVWLLSQPALLDAAQPFILVILSTMGTWMTMQKAYSVNDVTRPLFPPENHEDDLPDEGDLVG